MKKQLLYALYATFLAGLTALLPGCDNSGDSNFVERYVLDGIMPIGQPLSIRLTRSVDVDDYYDSVAVGVTGAQVMIWESLNGDTASYTLIEDTTRIRGTYTATGTADTAKAGYDYSIRIEIGGEVLTAATYHAPSPIRIDSCKVGGLNIASFADETELETVVYNGDDPYQIYVSPGGSRAGLNFVIECLEPDWYYNEDRQVSGNNGPDPTNVWFWTVRYSDPFEVPWITTGFQGKYRVRAMAIDSAGFDFFVTAFPGNDRTDPRTNVNGGLGVFTLYDADTAFFCLEDPDADVFFPCQP